MPLALLLFSFGGFTVCSIPARALEPRSDATRSRPVKLRASVKWTNLLSHAPCDTVLYPERWSAAALFRARLGLEARPASWLQAEVAYEHRARTVSEGSGAGGAGAGVLPSKAPAPYRLSQLDEPLVTIGTSFRYRHELDRCLVTLRSGRTDLTLGRQAIGWGRGVLFSAVDIFAPFTPLESDREWRRGIDAARLSASLTSRLAVDLVAALGDSVEASAFVARLQSRVADLDAELFAGRRREDGFYALAASAPVLDAELHGEFALFRTPEPVAGGGAFGSDDLAAKAVLGGSYSLELPFELPADLPAGVVLVGEYHYSGFGLPDVRDLERWGDDGGFVRAPDFAGESDSAGESDPVDGIDFVQRFRQGDSQILGRQAGALQLTYGFATMSPVSLSWIFSLGDGSGVLVPTLTWIFSDHVTLTASGYAPYGATPVDGELRSEYGGTPASGLVQVGISF